MKLTNKARSLRQNQTDVINNIEGVLEKIYLVILEITGKKE